MRNDIFNRKISNNDLVVIPYITDTEDLKIIAGVLKTDKVYYLDENNKLRFIWIRQENNQMLVINQRDFDDSIREYYNDIFTSLANRAGEL